jgi:type I restriction enzyme S subunit
MMVFKLAEICEFVSGGTPSRNVPEYFMGNIPWITGADIIDDCVQSPRYYITEKAIQESATNIVPAGNILLVTRTGVGKVAITEQDICISQDFTGLIIDSKRIDKKYLYHYLRSQKEYFLSNQRGATIKGVTRNVVENLEVPIPYPDDPARSLAEQRRIAARLETLLGEARALREEVQSMRRDLAQVMESALAEAFPAPQQAAEGWGWKRLGDIAPEDSRQILPTDYPEQLFNYWGLDAIEKGQIDEPVPNIVSGSYVQSTCVKFTSEHVLYCKLRPYLNKVIVPSVEGIGSTEWVPLKPNPEIIERKYLAFVLRTPQFVQYATSNVAGARMPRMSKRALGETKIPIPYPDDPARSLAEQRRIVASLERIAEETRAMDALLAQDLRDLDALEQSILAAAFRGE